MAQYLCIDLKSFFASVECVERGLDPMTTRLVVADPDRSVNTICLAVTPALKACGVRNRCRIREIPSDIDYIIAPPRMRKYLDYSEAIYALYLRYIEAADIHVYSIDEAFLDVTDYLSFYGLDARGMAKMLMGKVYEELGLRATCGIGTNLYLTKIALDILAKHAPDFIGELDEERYRATLWDHRPLTDFWQIGPATAHTLERRCLYTMRDIAHAPEEWLYRQFGVDAELLIDHAWGREPVTMAQLRAYRPQTHSLTGGQVLMRDYTTDEAELIVKEMTDALCLDMTEKRLVAGGLTLTVGYSGRTGMRAANGSVPLTPETNLGCRMLPAVTALYRRIVTPGCAIRRLTVACTRVVPDTGELQLSFFEDADRLRRDQALQRTVADIRRRYGKNALLRGISYAPAATARERNHQIGGHKSGE